MRPCRGVRDKQKITLTNNNKEETMLIPSTIRVLLCLTALNVAGVQAASAETLRLARNADIKILDPVLTQDNVDIWILPSIYETLTYLIQPDAWRESN